jgi:hypothetical protein
MCSMCVQDVKALVTAVPSAEFTPLKLSYYRKEVQPKLYFAVLTVLALVLLTYFILW